MQCRTYLFVGALSLAGASAQAQQLFTFTEPVGPVAVQSAAAVDGDTMGPAVIGPIDIDLDLELLRSRPEGLLIPVVAGGPPQRILLRHFEDRGNGDLVWSGAAAGGWAETHVVTVLDDVVIGSFWDDRGYRTELVASSGGGGVVRSASNANYPDGDWCLDVLPDAEAVRQAVGHRPPTYQPSSRQAARSEAAGKWPTNEVDITFVASEGAIMLLEDAYGMEADAGYIEAYFQSLADFGSQVFRNTRVPIRLNVRGIETEGFDYELDSLFFPFFEILFDGAMPNRVQAIRAHHGSDLVHILSVNVLGLAFFGVCGAANLYGPEFDESMMAANAFGHTNATCGVLRPGENRLTFIHELGHNFGLNHNWQVPHFPIDETRSPHVGYGFLSNPRSHWRDPLGSPTPKRKETGAFSIMAYRPKGSLGWLQVPMFSAADKSFFLRPGDYGMESKDPTTRWAMGRRDQISARQLLLDTGADIAALSDYQWRLSRGPDKLHIDARDNGDGTITLDFKWEDKSDDETGFYLTAYTWWNEVDLENFKSTRVDGPNLQGIWLLADTTEASLTRDALPSGHGMTWRVSALNHDGPTPSQAIEVGPVERPPMPVFGAANADVTRIPFWFEEEGAPVLEFRSRSWLRGHEDHAHETSISWLRRPHCGPNTGCYVNIDWSVDRGVDDPSGEILVLEFTAANPYGSQTATIEATVP